MIRPKLQSIVSNLGTKLDLLSVISDSSNDEKCLMTNSAQKTQMEPRMLECPSFSLFQTPLVADNSKTDDEGNSEEDPNQQAEMSQQHQNAQQVAIANLSRVVQHDKFASEEMASALLETFSSLVDANLHQYFKRNFHWNDQVAKFYASSFFPKTENAKSPISFASISTRFFVDENADHTDAHLDQQSMTLPIRMQIFIQVMIHGEKFMVSLQVGGTATGCTLPDQSNILDVVKVQIDSSLLLSNLRNKARMVVWKAVQSLTDNNHLQEDNSPLRHVHIIQQEQDEDAVNKSTNNTSKRSFQEAFHRIPTNIHYRPSPLPFEHKFTTQEEVQEDSSDGTNNSDALHHTSTNTIVESPHRVQKRRISYRSKVL